MTKSLLFSPLALLICLSVISSQTCAKPGSGENHLNSYLTDHKGDPIHGHGGHETHKRGGCNHPWKRCKSPEHTPDRETPSTSQASTNMTNQSSTTPESKKWGLAWANGDAPYLKNFARPKVRYLYTWSPYLPSMPSDLELEGIPMLWGWKQIDDFQRMVVQGYATKVFGMNEPNEPSQANMSPDDGISLWKQYIDPLKNQGYYLISPACTNDQAGLDWMKAFVEGCTDCRIDAIAFHFYGTDPEAFVEFATSLHDSYAKPIWITEFADQNFSGSGPQASMSEVYAFQSAVVDFVDKTPWIEAAFPFGVMHNMNSVNEGNSLLTADGWPTSLAYNYFG